MPTVPTLQVLYRRRDDIMFGWKPLKNTEAKYYNLYASPTSAGAYTLVKSKILNQVDESVYKGKVISLIKDADVPIPSNPSYPPEQGGVVLHSTRYYFKLTFVDLSNVESNLASSPAILVHPPNVEPFFENEDEVKNNHNMAWVESRKRWEKMQLSDDGDLKVEADINIDTVNLGNVKVAARPDGTTLEYIFVDDNRKLVIRSDPNSIDRISDYEEKTSVPKNIETTILTYTNTLAYFLEKIVCSGTCDALFKLKIDGTTTRSLRNSWNNRNVTFDYSTIAKKIPPNAIITITVIHVEPNNHNFESNLEGFTFTI